MNDSFPTIQSPPGPSDAELEAERDAQHARDVAEWFATQDRLDTIRETLPATAFRLSGVHAAVVPTGNSGKDAYSDFPGDVIRAHQSAGWLFVARHVIWKEPLAVRNRTMAKNLAHKTICENAAFGGVAAPDELLIFRKPGNAEPIDHPNGLTSGYAGAETIPAELLRFRGWSGDQKLNRYSHWIWRRYASSVWDDVRLGRVLPFRDARDEDDEKHVHPLQLDVIERFLDLRTRPGERVLTPFMGVGSEVYAAVQMGRYAIGAELKPSYFEQAKRNLAAVDDESPNVEDVLFDDEVSL